MVTETAEQNAKKRTKNYRTLVGHWAPVGPEPSVLHNVSNLHKRTRQNQLLSREIKFQIIAESL
jgi:hypothetical protein